MNRRTIKASEFKAKCLQLMDEINETGDVLTITKNGKPVAELLPRPESRRSPLGLHKGQVRIRGDLDEPFDAGWEDQP